jgi:hypothetical protein
MNMGVYEVTGKREYRGHARGEVFEARIEPGAERRAVDRGDIVLLRRVIPTLPDGFCLPDGWIASQREE